MCVGQHVFIYFHGIIKQYNNNLCYLYWCNWWYSKVSSIRPASGTHKTSCLNSGTKYHTKQLFGT